LRGSFPFAACNQQQTQRGYCNDRSGNCARTHSTSQIICKPNVINTSFRKPFHIVILIPQSREKNPATSTNLAVKLLMDFSLPLTGNESPQLGEVAGCFASLNSPQDESAAVNMTATSGMSLTQEIQTLEQNATSRSGRNEHESSPIPFVLRISWIFRRLQNG
jgi:hypothetical protein